MFRIINLSDITNYKHASVNVLNKTQFKDAKPLLENMVNHTEFGNIVTKILDDVEPDKNTILLKVTYIDGSECYGAYIPTVRKPGDPLYLISPELVKSKNSTSHCYEVLPEKVSSFKIWIYDPVMVQLYKEEQQLKKVVIQKQPEVAPKPEPEATVKQPNFNVFDRSMWDKEKVQFDELFRRNYSQKPSLFTELENAELRKAQEERNLHERYKFIHGSKADNPYRPQHPHFDPVNNKHDFEEMAKRIYGIDLTKLSIPEYIPPTLQPQFGMGSPLASSYFVNFILNKVEDDKGIQRSSEVTLEPHEIKPGLIKELILSKLKFAYGAEVIITNISLLFDGRSRTQLLNGQYPMHNFRS